LQADLGAQGGELSRLLLDRDRCLPDLLAQAAQLAVAQKDEQKQQEQGDQARGADDRRGQGVRSVKLVDEGVDDHEADEDDENS